MREVTRQKFTALHDAMKHSYGLKEGNKAFSISEPMETRLNDAVQESSEFLNRITMLPVVDRKGQSLSLGVYSPIAKRTNTANKDRTATPVSSPDGAEYECKLTEFDQSFSYDLLDAWARYDNFMERYMTQVYRRIALDRILVGWHGESAAVESDLAGKPALEDINIGWIKLLETNNAANYLTESQTGTGQITIGTDGDYKNLDALVYDIYSMIGDGQRSGSEVAIVGRHLIADDMGKALASYAQQPTEKSQVMVLDKAYGGLPSISVPGFPDTGVIVTDTENLSIYFQTGKTRRQLVDNPKRNRVEDFISSNDAYMIENFHGIAGIDAANLVIKDAAGTRSAPAATAP